MQPIDAVRLHYPGRHIEQVSRIFGAITLPCAIVWTDKTKTERLAVFVLEE